jgi:signal transduction histidine kinase
MIQNKKRAEELVLANRELAYQRKEQEKRAAELSIANQELVFQNKEKENRAAELIIANQELVFQNKEKEKRAAELIIANKELAFQNEEKEKRAAELIIANKELAFQNEEKEKRAAELIIANRELVFQNKEKESRAAELIIANKELVFQNEEKEKRAAELIITNKKLVAFTYISSHDLQEPMRKIQTFSGRLLETESQNLSEAGKDYFQRMQAAARRMQQLLNDLLAFSRVSSGELKFEHTDMNLLIEEVKNDLKETIEEANATFEINPLGSVSIVPIQFRQLIQNLLTNALKFSTPGKAPHIIVKSRVVNVHELQRENILPAADAQAGQREGLLSDKSYYHLSFSDNGIGFEPEFKEQIFEVFQRLHSKIEYEGTGIGLAIVMEIIKNHEGIITATSELGKGATFDIYIPD